MTWSDESTFQIVFFGNHGRKKIKKTIQIVASSKVQKPESVMALGVFVPMALTGVLHVSEDTVNAEMYRQVLEQHMLPSRPGPFSFDNAKNHSVRLHSERECGPRQARLSAVQTCLPLKM